MNYDVYIKDGAHADRKILANVVWEQVLDYLKNLQPEVELKKHGTPYISISEAYIREK